MKYVKRPACFDSDAQWTDWLEKAVESRVQGAARSFCIDCTPTYQGAMVRERRCTHPETVFWISSDGLTGTSGDRYGWVQLATGMDTRGEPNDRRKWLLRPPVGVVVAYLRRMLAERRLRWPKDLLMSWGVV